MPMWVLLALLALEVPAVVALADCYDRPVTDFPGGEDDRHGWKVWLWVGLATAWIAGLGNIVVLGYHASIVSRSRPLGRG